MEHREVAEIFALTVASELTPPLSVIEDRPYHVLQAHNRAGSEELLRRNGSGHHAILVISMEPALSSQLVGVVEFELKVEWSVQSDIPGLNVGPVDIRGTAPTGQEFFASSWEEANFTISLARRLDGSTLCSVDSSAPFIPSFYEFKDWTGFQIWLLDDER